MQQAVNFPFSSLTGLTSGELSTHDEGCFPVGGVHVRPIPQRLRFIKTDNFSNITHTYGSYTIHTEINAMSFVHIPQNKWVCIQQIVNQEL